MERPPLWWECNYCKYSPLEKLRIKIPIFQVDVRYSSIEILLKM